MGSALRFLYCFFYAFLTSYFSAASNILMNSFSICLSLSCGFYYDIESIINSYDYICEPIRDRRKIEIYK